MKSFYNIEKSGFPNRQYVGYCNGDVWQIYGKSGNWNARKTVGNIAGCVNILLMYDTLAEISEELTALENTK